MTAREITTQRLRLRQWIESDATPFAKLNSNPKVMKHFPKTLNRMESDAVIARFSSAINDRGWGFWAVELNDCKSFVGFIGLSQLPVDHPLASAVEIGWRLLPGYWGHGFASEGATACLKYAFENLQLNEIVAQTPIQNSPSEGVMKKIGMIDQDRNFAHPALSLDHPLSIHLHYRITFSEYLNAHQGQV